MESGATWSAIEVDGVEPIDWRRTGISWRPVRQALGVEIVGVAGFTAHQACQIVIEPHTEVADGRGQQEVYVVIRGRAQFTIDGRVMTAVPGTLIRVDPQAHREAVSLDADTAVLALGGESVFEPSASEWIERARPHIRSAPARAQEIIDDMRACRPSDRAGDVGEALLAVGSGETARAREILSKLVSDGPEIRSALEADQTSPIFCRIGQTLNSVAASPLLTNEAGSTGTPIAELPGRRSSAGHPQAAAELRHRRLAEASQGPASVTSPAARLDHRRRDRRA